MNFVESINTDKIVQIISYSLNDIILLYIIITLLLQKLSIKGPKNTKIRLHTDNQDIILYNEEKGCYTFLITDSGNYEFYIVK